MVQASYTEANTFQVSTVCETPIDNSKVSYPVWKAELAGTSKYWLAPDAYPWVAVMPFPHPLH